MKEIVLPKKSPTRNSKYSRILSARVTNETHKKWIKLQCITDEAKIRPCDLMEYMVVYFYDEVFGEEDE
jgi:hypothetical protein